MAQDEVLHTFWEVPEHFFEPDIDKLNFGLNENLLSVCLAIVTGCIMLFLLDITFHLVVRARSTEIATHAIQRRWIFSSAINPLKWNDIFHQLHQQRSKNRKETGMMSSLATGTIIITAILLLLTELTIIFLSSSREVVLPTRVEKLPTFSIRTSVDRVLNLDQDFSCAAHDLTKRLRVTSRVKLQTCFHTYSFQVARNPVMNGLAYVQIFQVQKMLGFSVIYNGSMASTRLSSYVALQNGTKYTVLTDEASEVAAKALSTGLSIWGFTPLFPVQTATAETWNAGVLVNISALKPASRPCQVRGAEFEVNALLRYPWYCELTGIIRGLFVLNGTNRAYIFDHEKGPFLDQMEAEPFFAYVGPYLSLGVALIILAALIVLRSFVVFILGWTTGVDEWCAWVFLFSSDNEKIVPLHEKIEISSITFTN